MTDTDLIRFNVLYCPQMYFIAVYKARKTKKSEIYVA